MSTIAQLTQISNETVRIDLQFPLSGQKRSIKLQYESPDLAALLDPTKSMKPVVKHDLSVAPLH